MGLSYVDIGEEEMKVMAKLWCVVCVVTTMNWHNENIDEMSKCEDDKCVVGKRQIY